jgi:1-acyl-sn-glycerol-3-phosphate acyltransferase
MFYWVVKAILAPILRLVFRPWAEGTQYVPRTGPAIIASNHLSFSDHFFAPLPLPRKVVFLAKSEYFTGRGIKGLFSRAFFSGVGQIPVDRSGGEASERALNTGLRVLAEGNLLGIYPEGTRTPDGRLFRGKTGVARLALEARVPVIPCAMIGGFEFQPPGRIAPRLAIRPGVKFGPPLDFSRYYGLETDRIILRAVTDEIIYAIMTLSGQEYVDEYAQRHKSRTRPPAPAPGAADQAEQAAAGSPPDARPGPSPAEPGPAGPGSSAAAIGEPGPAGPRSRAAAIGEPGSAGPGSRAAAIGEITVSAPDAAEGTQSAGVSAAAASDADPLFPD